MKECFIKLSTIVDVKKFITEVSKLDTTLDVGHGRHCVDGKSIMGVLSLDLSNNLSVKYDDAVAKAVEKAVAPWRVDA